MAFLRSTSVSDSGPEIDGERVCLRMPRLDDYAQWARLRAQSREFLVPWEPTWADDELTRASYKRRIRFYHTEYQQASGYAFFLFRKEDDRLVGGLTLSNVRRGVTQSAALGYWIGVPYSRQGLMSRGVEAAGSFVFDVLHLHRLEAACLPGNSASIRLLERTGFRREGLAREFLKINGVWQDHLLYALVAEDQCL